MLRDGPIARRLTILIVVVSGFSLLLTSAAFAGYQYWSFRSTTLRNLTVRGQIIAANSTAALAFGDSAAGVEILSALSADSHVRAAVLFDVDGRPLARYPADLPDAELSDPQEDGYRFSGGLAGRLVGYQPVIGATGRIGTLYLASDLGALYDSFWLGGLIGAGVFVVALLSAYWASQLLQGTLSVPIRKLAETAKTISDEHDYSVRAPTVANGGELAELTEAFNHMLGHIQSQNQEVRAARDKLEGYAQELERRVQERTQALQEANDALRLNAANLTAANKELDAFAYSVSHDLRAPLRSIDGFSHVLTEDYGDKLDDTGRDYLGRVRAASQRMGMLIDDLLRLARISRVEMHKEPVDVSEMASQIASDLRASDTGRRVEFTIAPDLQAWADKRLLQVVLDNLIRNSWKYSAKKSDARIQVDLIPCNGSSAFRVRDNGAGFDMKYSDKLFGEFQRLHSASEFEGTGVGLATVRRIVARHGGKIWAEGAVGEGAAFYFTLAPRTTEPGDSHS